MSLTGSIKLASTPASGDFAEAAAAETAAENAESLALEGVAPATGNDWTYSATAEGRTGEVAVNSIDLDGEPGLIYSGPEGGAVSIRVVGLDVSEGTIAPEAADSVTAAIMLNNDVLAYADEGFVNEIDTATAVEFNASTYVGNLKTGDVLRVALVGGAEETADWDVAVGGKLTVV